MRWLFAIMFIQAKMSLQKEFSLAVLTPSETGVLWWLSRAQRGGHRGVGALDVFRSGVWLDFSFRPVEKTKEGPSWGRHLQLECFAGRRRSKETGGREEAQVRSPPAHCLGRKHTEAGSCTKNTHYDFFFFLKFGCFSFVLKLHSSAGRFHAFCCCWKSV